MSFTTPKKLQLPGQISAQLKGQLAVLATAVLMSTNGLFVKLLPWHATVILCLRSVIAVIFLLVLRIVFPPPKESKKNTFAFWASGIFFAATMYTLIIAFKLTTSANAILLQFGAPVWAALLGWFLIKEKPHWEHWLALVLVLGGLTIFFRDSLGGGGLGGDILAIFSGILYGATSVFLRMMKTGNTRDAMLLAHVICAVTGIPFLFIYPPTFTAFSALAITYMGTIQIGLATLLFAYGVKRISAVQTMLTTVAEPLLNPVWVLFLAGEKPSKAALFGGSVIITAVVVSSLISMKRENKKPEAEKPYYEEEKGNPA